MTMFLDVEGFARFSLLLETNMSPVYIYINLTHTLSNMHFGSATLITLLTITITYFVFH